MKADMRSKDNRKYFVYVRDLIGVQTNADDFRWSFGSAAPEASEAEFDACRIKVDLAIVKDKDVPLPEPLRAGAGNFRYFHALRNRGTVCYHRKLFGLPLSYAVTVRGNVIRAQVGRTYYRLVRLKVMNLHPIWYILFDLATVLLLQNGYLPVYAASFAYEDRGALVMGPPNMGKTLTALRLSENGRIRLLGEDIAVTDGERICAVPWTDTYRRYGAAAGGRRRGAFPEAAAQLRHVFLLERGSAGEQEAADDCAQKIALLNRYGIGWHSAPAVTVLCYFNDAFSPDDLLAREADILRRMTERSAVCTVRAENAADYAPRITALLQRDETDINCPAALI